MLIAIEYERLLHKDGLNKTYFQIMIKINRCYLGFHKWGKWIQEKTIRVYAEGDNPTTSLPIAFEDYQHRICENCGKKVRYKV